jgi:hypothetical protein
MANRRSADGAELKLTVWFDKAGRKHWKHRWVGGAPLPPGKQRAAGTNSRANGTNPRAKGTNPRALE